MPSSSPNQSGSLPPAPLSPEREAEIRERASAATAGPWGTYHENPQSDGVRLIDIAASLQDTGHGYRCRRYIAQTESGQIDNDRTHRDWGADQDNQQSADDAEFIAHAREDVPALLAEVDRLRARVAELERAAGAGRASLANLMRDHEDPGAAAFGALSMLNQATPAVEAQFDEAAEVLNRRDAAVLDSAADELAERQERLASAYADSDITGDGPEAVLNAWQQAEDEVRHLASKAVSA